MAWACDQANRYGTPLGMFGAVGGIVCPVPLPVHFVDTWGAPRSGGRTHKGQDLFAASATPSSLSPTAPSAARAPAPVWAAEPLARNSRRAPSGTTSTSPASPPASPTASKFSKARSSPSTATPATPPPPHPTCTSNTGPTGRYGPDVNPYLLLSAACPGHVAPLP